MIGPRGRIGILVPSDNVVLEYEFFRMAPNSISVHASRIGTYKMRDKYNVEASKALAEDLENATWKLVVAKVNVICYGCTSGSFIEGSKWERNLVRRMMSVSLGIPAITTSGAVLEAFKELRMKKLSVVTPYGEDINKRLKDYLTCLGLEIVGFKSLDIPNDSEQMHSVESSYELAKEVYRPEADGIFISCTDFRTIENIEKIEEETQKPVVTSNQASMWASLKKIGYKEPVEGYGELLKRL